MNEYKDHAPVWEWCANAFDRVKADTTDEELQVLSNGLNWQAATQRTTIGGNVYDYLRGARDSKRQCTP